MKILQVVDQLKVGGAEKMFVEICNMLYKLNHSVEILYILSDHDLDNKIDQQIPRIHFNRTEKYNIKEYRKLAKILTQYDIVHVHMRHNFRYVYLVKRLFRVKTKVILHDHSSKFTGRNLPLKTILKPRYYIGVSQRLVDWAKNTLGINKKNIYYLRNSVGKTIVQDPSKGKKGFVVVGNIKPLKNQLFAIELMQKFDTELTLIGKIQDEEYFSSLKERVKELNLQDKVHFVHDVDHVQSELHKYELGLMTSTSESGPLVTIEYLAQGLPFVTNNVGEVTKEIYEEIKPQVVDGAENIDEWVEKIQKTRKNPPNNLESIYERHFSPEDYIEKCLKIYQNILDS